MLINFSLPEIGDDAELEAWKDLQTSWDKAGSCVGYIVSLEQMLQCEGFKEINVKYVPKVKKSLKGCLPRVLPGYATLMWFTEKVKLIVVGI